MTLLIIPPEQLFSRREYRAGEEQRRNEVMLLEDSDEIRLLEGRKKRMYEAGEGARNLL